MKRRAFLKSLAASVAGLFCANVAAKKAKPNGFIVDVAGVIPCDDAAEYIDGRYWVRGGLITANEMRAIEEKYLERGA